MTPLIKRTDMISIGPEHPVISIAGAGGKTTLMFDLAKITKPAVMTTTTKVGAEQIRAADICLTTASFPPEEIRDRMWVSPSLEPCSGKIHGCPPEAFSQLAALCRKAHITLINEADGAARRHIKAPAEYEPVIPKESDICIYIVGLDVLGKRVNPETVHRPEIFAKLTGAAEGDIINADSIFRLLEHPNGGLKNMPQHAKKVVYLTHTDRPERLRALEYIASKLRSYDYLSF